MLRNFKFFKMHGCGNDFVIIDALNHRNTLNLTKRRVQKLTARGHGGIGCDQLIILVPPRYYDQADLRMRIFNPDGVEVRVCGNAARCIANLLGHGRLTGEPRSEFHIEAGNRLLNCKRLSRSKEFWVNMGEAKLMKKAELIGETIGKLVGLPSPLAVDIGNPHCIFMVEDAEAVNVAKWGPRIEMHPLFRGRTNVEFVSPIADNEFRMRVWERGTGITLACGSGVAAAAWALRQFYESDELVHLHMDGGVLSAIIMADSNVYIKGETTFVYDGNIGL